VARQKKHRIPKRNWLVIAPLQTVIVPATDEDEAKRKVLAASPHGLSNKIYLARDWTVREATAEEIERYTVWADNWRPSQPTWKTTKNPRKPTQERLV
jgi:hypothetical protein